MRFSKRLELRAYPINSYKVFKDWDKMLDGFLAQQSTFRRRVRKLVLAFKFKLALTGTHKIVYYMRCKVSLITTEGQAHRNGILLSADAHGRVSEYGHVHLKNIIYGSQET